jgi:predicted SprT family Zn-dependent metalloprotease
MNGTDDLSRCPKLIRRWTRRWGVPALAGEITCQWSPRLRRSLGRAYPDRKIIRLSLLLQQPRYAPLFQEVLCHEAAHIAVARSHGRRTASHGPQWQELVRLAGYEPRRCLTIESVVERPASDLVRYEHICPICHVRRFATRPHP